jgi:hypothetical protein
MNKAGIFLNFFGSVHLLKGSLYYHPNYFGCCILPGQHNIMSLVGHNVNFRCSSVRIDNFLPGDIGFRLPLEWLLWWQVPESPTRAF